MTTTLIVYPLNDAGVEVPHVLDTTDAVDISMTLTVQDITDVTKRQGSFSKTITLPSTTANDACFGYAYNVQSFIGGFKPNKRIRAALWHNGIQVFNGSLQLLSITRTRGEINYEVGIYSEEVAFFRQINETLLCQTAGVSGMSHTLSDETVTATWSAARGENYVYGFLDGYGYTDVIPSFWNAITTALLVPFQSLTPSIYVKQMVDLIFAQAGYRYSSAFFNSERFKNLVIPYAGGPTIQFDLKEQNSYLDAIDVVTWQNSGGGLYFGIIDFNVITDPQGYWTNEVFTNINFYTTWDYYIEFDLISRIADITGNVDVEVTWFCLDDMQAVGTKTFDSWTVNQTKTIAFTGSIRFDPSKDYVVKIFYFFTGEDPLNVFGFGNGKASMICTENLNAITTVDMVKALPMDITQADLLSDLQKMFNLYFYVSPTDPKLIYIEPFNDFYNQPPVDYSQKVDMNAEMLINMGDPEMRKQITFKYKDSGDALGKNYSDVFAQGYGARVFKTDNYYAQDEQVVETKCATVIPANYRTGLVIGRTFDLNANGSPKPRPNGYRIAQYNLIPSQSWVMYIDASPTFAVYTSLPYIGHVNNPYDPAFDLAFGMPMQLYYKVFAEGEIVPYTNSNLFNIYWKTYIDETTSKEAMQIECSAILDAVDIYELDFRRPIYWNGILWRLLEIRDYQVGGEQPCTLVLRRILNLTQPLTGAIPIKNFYDVSALTLGEMNPQIANPTEI